MKSGWLVLTAATALLGGCAGADDGADLPYGTVQQMMANEVQPTADIFWKSVGSVSELIDDKPVFREWKPDTPEEWAEVEAAAARLGELGAELGSADYSAGRNEDWQAFTKGMVDAAAAAQKAAADKDADAVFRTGGDLYNVCSACHRAYPAEAGADASDPLIGDPSMDAPGDEPG